ncbi:MAG: hypothetical protein ACRC3H_12925 [Lachnospiraceae bacterium]
MMKKRDCVILGFIATIIGGTVLSMELYCIKFLQHADSIAFGQCNTYISTYIFEFPVNIALLISLIILIGGIVLLMRGVKDKN